MADEDLRQLVKLNDSGDMRKAKTLTLAVLKEGTGLGVAFEAYHLLQTERIERFLRAFWVEAESLTPGAFAQLDKHLQSEVGQRILVEYVERAARTLSDWGRRALALLFADELLKVEASRFHRFAADAIPGLANEEIEFFLKIATELKQKKPLPQSVKPTDVHTLWLTSLRLQGLTEERLFEDLEEFVRRGLIARDPSPSKLGGDGEGIIIGWTTRSTRLAEIFDRAKALQV